MNDYDDGFYNINQTQQQQFLHTNNIQVRKASNNNQQEIDDSPFQQLQSIMNQQQMQKPRNEIILVQKVNELQSKCDKLARTNSYLTKRIERKEQQEQQERQVQIDLLQLQQFIDELQNEFQSYKQGLQLFQNQKISANQKLLDQIQQLTQTIQQQKDQIDQLKIQSKQLMEANTILQRNNKNLQIQIERYQRQLNQQRSIRHHSKVKSLYRHKTSAFQDQVQAELQQLIQKLMNELQFQRSSLKKSMIEIKRMQQQILQLQREIVSKNNKIYQLQLDNLKNQKGMVRSQRSTRHDSSLINKPILQNSQVSRNKSDRVSNSVLKSFYIEQVLSGAIEVNEKERYIIASKVINFYIKKIEANDFVPYNSDKLLVSNFNKVNPSLIIIRKRASSSYSGDLSLSKLGWNLGVILSNLFVEWKNEELDQNQLYLQHTIQALLRQKLCNVEEVYSLKSVVDQIIKTF